MIKKFYTLLVIVTLALMLSACGNANQKGCGGICSNESGAYQVYEFFKNQSR